MADLIPRTRPLGGTGYKANGTCTTKRVAVFSTPDSNGRPRVAIPAASGVAANPPGAAGIVAETVADGAKVEVIDTDGCICTAEAGAAITAPARLTWDNVGRVVTAAPAAGANAGVIGYALQDAAAAGDHIAIVIQKHVMQGQ